jgi:hypothetical protein
MFVLRPACAGDQEPIAAMIRARSAWMCERGMNGWDSWESSAGVLAAQASDPLFPVWVLTGSEGGVAGCTSLYEQSPPWFWTEAGQPAASRRAWCRRLCCRQDRGSHSPNLTRAGSASGWTGQMPVRRNAGAAHAWAVKVISLTTAAGAVPDSA